MGARPAMSTIFRRKAWLTGIGVFALGSVAGEVTLVVA
jgi:hypothetical protein